MLEAWAKACAELNVTLEPHRELTSWQSAQDAYEHQLYLLNQRQTLQLQIHELHQQGEHYQQAVVRRRASLAETLQPLALSLPPEGEEEAWLAARAQEAEQWQQQQQQLTALHERMALLTPIIDTLPADEIAVNEQIIPLEGWRQCIMIAFRCTANGRRCNTSLHSRAKAKRRWKTSFPTR